MKRFKFTTYLFPLLLTAAIANPASGQIQQIGQELHKLSIINDSVGRVNCLIRLGELYRSRNADSCFYYGMEAKRTATNIGYQKGQIDADHVIAFSLYKRGLYADALELLSKVLAHYQQFGDTEKMIRVYMDMAGVENKGISDRPRIISLFQKAIQAGQKLKKDSIMSHVYINYCSGNPGLTEDSVRYYLHKSRAISSRYKDEYVLIFNQLWQARLLISNNQKEQALPLITQSLADAQRIGNTQLEINALMTLYNYENNSQKKLEYLYQEYEVAQKSGDKSLEIYILNSALDIAKELGDKDEIIEVYAELERAMTEEWEASKKFISDYVRFNAIANENKLLNEKNARRALWLVIISSFASIVVLAIYMIMLRRNRKAKEQVEALNHAANLQIISMEEEKQQAIREEQQRLGQDLHDGLSSSLAGIGHQLEVLAMDTDDAFLKQRLSTLKFAIKDAYETSRNKSHEWFSAAAAPDEPSFEQRIGRLIDSALPDSRYHKDIIIDDQSLARAGISLLRILGIGFA
ncbi:sensor histidine kinase, partial [Parapedobacter soli]|uniref:sensor histidine kinase n=1 Tax=Parapedobacter soli TaxID=416955 RepID=UPI0021CA0DD2